MAGDNAKRGPVPLGILGGSLRNSHTMLEHSTDMIGEHGVNLSGGQRQRISIARAIIRDTPILIFDEPTSGLDSASEQAVMEALERLMKGKTSIVIAHHLNTIRRADIVFVIKDSELVEKGTHDELLAAGGLYAESYKTQTSETEGKPAEQPAVS